MVNCLWNGERIDAFEISKPEVLEREIRKAAVNKELKCIDPNCECPELGFRHGAKREPHFYHYHNSNCNYTYFEKSDKPIIRAVRNALFDHFKAKGYDVQRECRLPVGGKFCHLLFNINDRKIVLQIVDKTNRVQEREKLQKACDDNKYELKWIVIGEPEENQDEYQNYHICRYLLNNSANKDLVIINETADMISQTKFFEGTSFLEHKSSFKMTASLEQLTFVNREISILGFYEEFNQKRSEILAEKKKQERMEKEERELSLKIFSQKSANPFQPIIKAQTISNISDAEYPHEIEEPSYPKIDDSKFVVGVRVCHEIYGIGTIVEIIQEKQKAKIKFDSGKEEKFTIENLAKSSGFKFIEPNV